MNNSLKLVYVQLCTATFVDAYISGQKSQVVQNDIIVNAYV